MFIVLYGLRRFCFDMFYDFYIKKNNEIDVLKILIDIF